LKHSIRHDLPPEQLRQAARSFAETYCERFKEYQANVVWRNEDQLEVCFKVKGIALRAELTLAAREIGVEMHVPFALRLFRSRAIKAIEDEVRPWLDGTRSQPS
jgi:hypothetical protein